MLSPTTIHPISQAVFLVQFQQQHTHFSMLTDPQTSNDKDLHYHWRSIIKVKGYTSHVPLMRSMMRLISSVRSVLCVRACAEGGMKLNSPSFYIRPMNANIISKHVVVWYSSNSSPPGMQREAISKVLDSKQNIINDRNITFFCFTRLFARRNAYLYARAYMPTATFSNKCWTHCQKAQPCWKYEMWDNYLLQKTNGIYYWIKTKHVGTSWYCVYKTCSK